MSPSNIALVTGASRGIGREIARQLVLRGVSVIVTARRPEASEAAARELGAAWGLTLDVADALSVQQAAEAVRARFGRLDILVNNAGILLDRSDSLLKTQEDLLRQTLETNTLGPLRTAQAFWGLLSSGGRIVNISSGGGQLSEPAGWAPAYCLSKTALNAVTVQLALEGARDGIAVNSVCPGWVRTDMGGAAAPRSVTEGADTAVWLALEAPGELSGKFWRDRTEIAW